MAVETATKPEGPTGDFEGDIEVNDKPPNSKMLASAASLPLLDEKGKKHTFKSLYEGKGRVIVVFVRHFFCGNCQEYTKTLSEEFPPATLSALSTPTSLVLIGCGAVELIPMYKNSTNTPYPIYADPTRKIYDVLGMTRTLSLGDKQPRYMRKPVYKLSLKSILQGLQSGRHALSGGDFWQVGGEFVFESNGSVDWCHRMRNTRDHAEMDELRKAIHMVSETETVAPVAPGKPIGSRRSMSGAGLVRKMSDRRKSWRNSIGRGRSGNNEANGNVPISTMEELKEESGAPDGDRDAALAKLAGTRDINHDISMTNGAIANGNAPEALVNGDAMNGHANGSHEPTEKLAPINGAAVEPVANGYVVESSAHGLADKATVNASLQNSTPFVQSLMNGTTEKKAGAAGEKGAEFDIRKEEVETENKTANGHIVET